MNVPQENLAGLIEVDSWRLPILKTLEIVKNPSADELKVSVDVDERPCTR